MKLNDDILLEYIDGTLNDNETRQVEELLEKDRHWKEQYEKLLISERTLTEMKPLNPSFNFTENVMKAVTKIEMAKSKRFNLGRANLKGLLVTIAGILVGVIILTVGVPEYSLAEPFFSPDQFKSPVVDATPVYTFLNSSLLVKAFLFFDAILAIFLIERFLFRPMVRNRSQRYSF